MRTLLEAVAAAVVIGAAIIGASRLDAARAEARAADDSLAVVRAERQEVERRKARSDSMVVALAAELAEERAQHEESADSAGDVADVEQTRAAEAGEDVDATVDTLRSIVRLEVVPVVDTLEVQIAEERDARKSSAEALRSQVGSLQDILAVSDSTTQLCRVQHSACEELADGLRDEVAALERARDAWRSAAEPGFFDGFGRAIPQLAAVGAISFGLGALVAR